MVERAPAFVGGDEEVVVTVAKSVEIDGRVETTAGERVPGREIEVASMVSLRRVKTAADGSFRMLVPRGRHTLCADDSGFCPYVDATQPVHGLVVKVSKPHP
jgi:hypothetical protein